MQVAKTLIYPVLAVKLQDLRPDLRPAQYLQLYTEHFNGTRKALGRVYACLFIWAITLERNFF